MERFTKRIVPECRRANRGFLGRGSFVDLEHVDKHFVKTQVNTLNHYTTLRGKFSKIRTFFLIFKKEQRRPAPSPVPFNKLFFLTTIMEQCYNDVELSKYLKILTGKKHPKIELQRLRKIRIRTFESFIHQINTF